jgi:hypothetical protein
MLLFGQYMASFTFYLVIQALCSLMAFHTNTLKSYNHRWKSSKV